MTQCCKSTTKNVDHHCINMLAASFSTLVYFSGKFDYWGGIQNFHDFQDDLVDVFCSI